jgi:hypothetical protein
VERRLGVRTLARLRVSETDPGENGASFRKLVERRRRQIQKWISDPVGWLEPENAEWVSRLLGIPMEQLLRPVESEEDRLRRALHRAERELLDLEERLRQVRSTREEP